MRVIAVASQPQCTTTTGSGNLWWNIYSAQRPLQGVGCFMSTTAAAASAFTRTVPVAMAMKPGTPIPGLDIFKDKDPPVALERSQYPEWVNQLVFPLKSLSELERINEETATLAELQRICKLRNRAAINERNNELRKK
ncbi:hypothetical protein ACA910_011376 [Epithemia clementina (nom. ined.)]